MSTVRLDYYYEKHLGTTRLPFWLYWIDYRARQLWTRGVCRYFGHDLVDDSVAGPDTGNVSVYCARCGWSHEVTLY